MSALVLFLECIMLFPGFGFGQDISSTLTEFNQQRIALNTNGMYVLSGWAIANIAVGSYGYLKTEGRLKYFHQMNAAWNVVNLSIAGLALYGYAHAHPNSFSLAGSIAEAHNIETILLLNFGLDAAYIAGGGFLWERGLRKTVVSIFVCLRKCNSRKSRSALPAIKKGLPGLCLGFE